MKSTKVVPQVEKIVPLNQLIGKMEMMSANYVLLYHQISKSELGADEITDSLSKSKDIYTNAVSSLVNNLTTELDEFCADK